jgi:hypothetical protein
VANLLMQRIRVASDCLNAIRNIGGKGKASYSHIVHEIKPRATDFHEV